MGHWSAQPTVRLPERTTALANAAPAAFSSDRPWTRNVNPSPTRTTLASAAELLGERGADPASRFPKR